MADEKELGRSYQLGISVGLQRGADEVMKWATGSFKLGKDSEARQMRCLSEHLAFMGKEARKDGRS